MNIEAFFTKDKNLDSPTTSLSSDFMLSLSSEVGLVFLERGLLKRL
jgi:hypothetical protein